MRKTKNLSYKEQRLMVFNMKTRLLSALCAAILAVGATYVNAEPLKIWDGVKMPGNITSPVDTTDWKSKPDRDFIATPVLEFHTAKDSKGIVILLAGGAYKALWLPKWEAQFLNKHGISAAILEYRVPDNFDGALMDIQRTIRLVRSKATKLGIDPNKIAVMGFSAGSSLAARASTNFKNPAYAPLDDIDKISARPDFTILYYPAYCSQPEKNRRFGLQGPKAGDDYNTRYKIAEWNVVDKDTPPAFITQNQPDPYVDASIAYYLALKDAGVRAELHMLPEHGHTHIDPDVLEILAKRLKAMGY